LTYQVKSNKGLPEAHENDQWQIEQNFETKILKWNCLSSEKRKAGKLHEQSKE
jgi:hypothetical protein